MNALRSIAMAFAMFSRIPMPRIEWKKENMRYMLCALPLVGAVIGLALMLWVWVCLRLKIGQTLFAAALRSYRCSFPAGYTWMAFATLRTH